MNALTQYIQNSNNQVTTTSEFIAQAFKKQHKDVIRKIDELLSEIPADFAAANFREITVSKPSNLGNGTIQSRAYELSKDGFMLLVMGFTGKAALSIKIAYINAFNAMAEQLQQLSGSPKAVADKTTSDDRAGLRQAVNILVGKKRVNYSAAYSLIHQRFNVEHIEQLSQGQITQAVEYVHRLTLDGEVLDKVLGKQQSRKEYDTEKLHNLIANLALVLRDYAKMLNLFQRSPFADENWCQFELHNLNKHYQGLVDLATQWELKTQSGRTLFEHNRINYYCGNAAIWG